ncbi:MAG TPA: right-handed parallel beta-helix repeat-containing protein [Candidatus Angelobacter sp.]|nr:right-handed parallel beta-helix repeat-containing protein [Candidatus Angelobacter sp.]
MPASGADWFVAAGSFGDGSREKPFHDPWQAFRSAGPGDVIHVAAGTYFGRYDRSSWVIDCPNLTVLGGYNRDFTARTPWKTPSVFAIFPEYEAGRESNMLGWQGEPSGLTLDGLFFDASGANTYGDKPGEGIRSWPNTAGAMVSFNAAEVTIRNCIFANGANGGVELSGAGSRFENNLLLNIIGIGMLDLRSSTTLITQPITVRNNSFCFIHDTSVPAGSGADSAIGIRVNCPAIVQDNIFVSCGNAAISLYLDPARVAVDRNLFFLTPRSILRSRSQGSSGEISEQNLEELEDIGVKSAAGNFVQAPGMAGLRPEWLDAYTRHLLANYAKPPRETANAVRAAAGLPVLAPGDLDKPENKGALAVRFTVPDALALAFTAQQGFHSVELTVNIAAQPAKPALTYRPVDWSVINAPDASLANAPVELRAGLGFEQNTTLLSDATPDSHMGVRIYEPFSDDSSIYVLIPRNTLPSRQFQEAIKYTRGMEVESAYLLRGVYRTDIGSSSRQKVTLVVKSIVPAPLVAANLPVRPQGRDWFVKAGSSGGDGTRERPFRDPFQALDKAEGGDAIHVAAGDYFGKLRSGQWRIAIRNLTLLGGYDADFAVRDPWANPTRFLLHEDEKAKGRPEGVILGSQENSDGLIVDGFIFDGATWNSYSADGSLNIENSPIAPLISLRGGRAPITVRNCLFLNGSSGAVIISCPYGVFENNIVLNASGDSLAVRADGPGPWTIRNNTVLFACDPTDRAGTGKSSSGGTLLQLSGRAAVAVDSNILGFADNFGVRASIPQQNVSFDNNVFAATLFNHLTDAGYLWADGSNWQRRAVEDSAFASFKGNKLELPRLPVDSRFADAALARLFTLPSRISKDEWTALAARIGATVTPPGSEVPAPTETAKPAAASSSLSDLLAQLDGLAKKKPAEASKAADSGASYCPLFDWKKALALAQGTSDAEPGAHRRKLAVAFSAPQARAPLEYTRITSREIDADHALLDHKAVELDVTQVRDSSTNSSLFPDGTEKDNFSAYSVTTASDATRTRIAIIVKLDTAASKLISRGASTDVFRIRGIVRVPADSSALSIVVDAAEAAGG